jgi:hypothetical protein
MHGAHMNSLKSECRPLPESESHCHGARVEQVISLTGLLEHCHGAIVEQVIYLTGLLEH